MLTQQQIEHIQSAKHMQPDSVYLSAGLAYELFQQGTVGDYFMLTWNDEQEAIRVVLGFRKFRFDTLRAVEGNNIPVILRDYRDNFTIAGYVPAGETIHAFGLGLSQQTEGVLFAERYFYADEK